MSNLARTRADSHEMMAEIFNNFDRNRVPRFLTGLEERNRESAEKVRALMFTFDDLIRLDRQPLRCFCARSKGQAGDGAQGHQDPVRRLLQLRRAGRCATTSAVGPVKMKDVEDAQTSITSMAKELAAAGEIEISATSDDKVIE